MVFNLARTDHSRNLQNKSHVNLRILQYSVCVPLLGQGRRIQKYESIDLMLLTLFTGYHSSSYIGNVQFHQKWNECNELCHIQLCAIRLSQGHQESCSDDFLCVIL